MVNVDSGVFFELLLECMVREFYFAAYICIFNL